MRFLLLAVNFFIQGFKKIFSLIPFNPGRGCGCVWVCGWVDVCFIMLFVMPFFQSVGLFQNFKFFLNKRRGKEKWHFVQRLFVRPFEKCGLYHLLIFKLTRSS